VDAWALTANTAVELMSLSYPQWCYMGLRDQIGLVEDLSLTYPFSSGTQRLLGLGNVNRYSRGGRKRLRIRSKLRTQKSRTKTMDPYALPHHPPIPSRTPAHGVWLRIRAFGILANPWDRHVFNSKWKDGPTTKTSHT
jgi:hypothetical protein